MRNAVLDESQTGIKIAQRNINNLKYAVDTTLMTEGLPWLESAWNAGDPGLILGSGRFPWGRKWQPTPVFLPEKSHGQRSLAGYIHGVAKSQTQLSSFFINEGEVVKIKTDGIWGH